MVLINRDYFKISTHSILWTSIQFYYNIVDNMVGLLYLLVMKGRGIWNIKLDKH